MLIVRPAKPGDEAHVVEMVRSLARFEKKSPDAVHLTEADVARDCVGENPRFHCELAFWDGELIGYALYFFTYSSNAAKPILYLEDIYVDDELRGKGIGAELLARLAAVAVEKGCCRMEWHVLTWNTEAIGFYDALGAHVDDSVMKVKCDPAELAQRLAYK